MEQKVPEKGAVIRWEHLSPLKKSLEEAYNKTNKKNSAFDILLHMHMLWLMNSAYIGVLETMNTMSEVKRNVPPTSPHFLKDYELYIFLDSW